jgi:hypothetical protein
MRRPGARRSPDQSTAITRTCEVSRKVRWAAGARPFLGHDRLQDPDHPGRRASPSRRAAASTTTAAAADPVAFEGKPVLVQLSGGAYVAYELTRKASGHVVTIDGTRAKVRTTDAPQYRGIVTRPGLKPGKVVTVRITVARPGKDLVRVDRLTVRRTAPATG